MGRQPVSAGGRAGATEYRDELLGRLGLRTDASDQDIESAHTELVEFLEAAPREVQSWAAAQTTDLDEAFALLSGPEEDLTSPAAPIFEAAPVETPPTPTAPAAALGAPPAALGAPTAGRPGRTRLLYAIVPLLAIAVIFGVWKIGQASEVPGISGTPTNNSTTAPAGAPSAVPVDLAKVAALTKKVTANPEDVRSLQGIADLYFASADYKTASVWERKILAVNPKNQVALLALGAAQFNAGNQAEAKKHWLVAAKLYPKNAEVHYDLGFLYLSQTPPDMAKMTAEWKKVVAIDPSSDYAKTVSNHLKSAPTPAASAKPSSK